MFTPFDRSLTSIHPDSLMLKAERRSPVFG